MAGTGYTFMETVVVDRICLLQHLRASLDSQASWPSPSGTQGRARLRLRAREGWLSSPTSAHSEVKLSVVTYLTNSIVDEILQELYHSHKSLVSLLNPSRAMASLAPRFILSPPAPSLKALGGGQLPWDPVHTCPSPGPAPGPAKDTIRSTRGAKPRAGSVLPGPRP